MTLNLPPIILFFLGILDREVELNSAKPTLVQIAKIVISTNKCATE